MYVRVTGEDWSRLGEEAEARTTWIANRAFMRMEDGRCASLEARPAGRFACAIYERRPAVCRTLERGSPACAAEIVRKSGARLPVWNAG